MDYSGFECESWPPRTGKRHREDAETLLACNTKKELDLNLNLDANTLYC